MDRFLKLTPENFPPALKEIADPPKQLWLEGLWPKTKDYHYLAVVGSRRYSRYGREACEDLIAGLAGHPIAIISGLAVGIDTIAHQSALTHKLPTIAVPGSGLDRSVLHPFSNHNLADDIIKNGGCLVSELEPLCPAGLHTFPRRNRIMAGLSEAVLIIEAGEKSGTLITARLALDYNRDVLVVPGSIFSSGSRGANKLIRQGATPINNSEDILEALHLKSDTNTSRQESLFVDLSPNEQKIISLLEIENYPRDSLIELSGLATSEANILLSTMEIKGLIKETLGEIRLT